MQVTLSEWSVPAVGGTSHEHDLGSGPFDANDLVGQLDGERFDLLTVEADAVTLFVGGGPTVFYVTAATGDGQRTAVGGDGDDLVEIQYGGQLVDVPSRQIVDREVAVEAVGHTLRHGSLAPTLRWT